MSHPFPLDPLPSFSHTHTHTHTLFSFPSSPNKPPFSPLPPPQKKHQELWDSQAFAKRFQQQVVGNLASIVDEIVDDMSETISQRARTQVGIILRNL